MSIEGLTTDRIPSPYQSDLPEGASGRAVGHGFVLRVSDQSNAQDSGAGQSGADGYSEHDQRRPVPPRRPHGRERASIERACGRSARLSGESHLI